MTVQNQKELER